MSSDFSLKRLIKKELVKDISSAVESSSSKKILICDKSSLAILNAHLSYSELIDLGLRRVEGLFNRREKDADKGAIYFCFPTEEGIKAFLADFEEEDPKYWEAIFISPCATPDEPFNLVRNSPARAYLTSWKDCSYDFSIFDERTFHFNQKNAFEGLFREQSLEDLDLKLDGIAEKVTAMLTTLRHTPVIKYYNPDGKATSLSARLAWKIYQKAQEYEDVSESWPKENKEALLILLDRSFDAFTPFMHSLSYHAAIEDLLDTEDGYKVNLPCLEEGKPILLDADDIHHKQLRHMFLGDAAEKIQQFIDENPAAASFYGNSNKVSTNDIKEQIYSINDATKIVDHRTIVQALIDAYGNHNLELVADLEQRLSTLENSFGEAVDKDAILKEIQEALENETIPPDDKLRLLLICQIRYPDIYFITLAQEKISGKASDGIAGLQRFLDGKKEIKYKFDYAQWKIERKNMGLEAEQNDPENYLNRYQPDIARIIEDITLGNLDEILTGLNDFTQVIEEIDTPDEKKRGNGLVIPFTSEFSPSWASQVPSDPEYREIINYFENGCRIIFFVLGGISLSESQTIHECCQKYQRGILLGSTSILNPTEFTNRLCYLGDAEMKRLELPSATSLIREELEKTKVKEKAKATAIVEEQRKEQDELEKMKQEEMLFVRKQKELEKKELEKENRIKAAFNDSDDETEEENLFKRRKSPDRGLQKDDSGTVMSSEVPSGVDNNSMIRPVIEATSTSLSDNVPDSVPDNAPDGFSISNMGPSLITNVSPVLSSDAASVRAIKSRDSMNNDSYIPNAPITNADSIDNDIATIIESVSAIIPNASNDVGDSMDSSVLPAASNDKAAISNVPNDETDVSNKAVSILTSSAVDVSVSIPPQVDLNSAIPLADASSHTPSLPELENGTLAHANCLPKALTGEILAPVATEQLYQRVMDNQTPSVGDENSVTSPVSPVMASDSPFIPSEIKTSEGPMAHSTSDSILKSIGSEKEELPEIEPQSSINKTSSLKSVVVNDRKVFEMSKQLERSETEVQEKLPNRINKPKSDPSLADSDKSGSFMSRFRIANLLGGDRNRPAETLGPATNRYNVDEAAALASVPIVYSIANPDDKMSGGGFSPSKSPNQLFLPRKELPNPINLFQPPDLRRSRNDGAKEGKKYISAARSALSDADTTLLGYDFSDDSLSRSSTRLTVKSDPSVSANPAFSGYQIPQRRHIAPTAMLINQQSLPPRSQYNHNPTISVRKRSPSINSNNSFQSFASGMSSTFNSNPSIFSGSSRIQPSQQINNRSQNYHGSPDQQYMPIQGQCDYTIPQYPPRQGQYPPQQQYPQQQYPQQQYPQQQYPHPSQQGQYLPPRNQYPGPPLHGNSGQYPPPQRQYLPQVQYPSQQGQLSPQQGQLSPQQGQLSPQQGQLSPQQGQFPPQQVQYPPPQGQHYPTIQYPPPQQSNFQGSNQSIPSYPMPNQEYSSGGFQGSNFQAGYIPPQRQQGGQFQAGYIPPQRQGGQNHPQQSTLYQSSQPYVQAGRPMNPSNNAYPGRNKN